MSLRASRANRTTVAGFAFALTALALWAVPASAGNKIEFVLLCPPDGFSQEDTFTVKIPAAAATFGTSLEAPPGTPLGPGQPICPGTTMSTEVTRLDTPSDTKNDTIRIVIDTSNVAGGGEEEDVEGRFEADGHADIGITKEAITFGGTEVNKVNEGRRFIWSITVTNHSQVTIQKNELKITDVLPRRFKFLAANVSEKKMDLEPPANGHGPTFTYKLSTDLRPGETAEINIQGTQGLPAEFEEMVVENEVSVEHLNKALTEPPSDPHPNEATKAITVKRKNQG